MFSVPISTAIGDNTYFQPKPARRDPEGHVITAPRNFTTKNIKKGNTDGVLFEKPDYVSIGDPFKETSKLPLRTTKKDGYKEAGHEMNFKPAKTVPQPVKADFQHMNDHVEVKKCRKGPDGAVVIEPRNFLTNPPKMGQVGKGTQFGEKFEHMADPFDRKKEIARKEREEHEKKL